MQIVDGNVSNYFLTTFGRATRESVCSCEVKLEPTLSQSLHMLNGDATTQSHPPGGLIAKRLAEKKTADQIIEELYLRTLVRRPSPRKWTGCVRRSKKNPTRPRGWKTCSGP